MSILRTDVLLDYPKDNGLLMLSVALGLEEIPVVTLTS